MKALKNRQAKAELKKAEKQVAALDAAAQRAQTEQALANLRAATAKGVKEAVRVFKAQQGKDASPDGPMIAASLGAFTRFLVANGVLQPGRGTDALVNMAIGVIVDRALAAKVEVEERRIITLG